MDSFGVDSPHSKKVEYFLNRNQSLESTRSNWMSMWEELATYFVPLKNDVYGAKKNQKLPMRNLLVNTSVEALETLAAGIHSRITNPNTYWFMLGTGVPELDEDEENRLWLQNTSYKLINLYNASNFNTEIIEVYTDAIGFGTAILSIEEESDPSAPSPFYFKCRPPYEFVIAENYRGEVDTVYFKFKWDLRKIVQRFGEDKLPSDMLAKYKKGNCEEQFEILFCVEPRTDLTKALNDELKNLNMPFVGEYILVEKKIILEEGGFQEFPYNIVRWRKLSGETWGRGKAMMELANAQMLQEQMRCHLRGLQILGDPPWSIPEEEIFRKLQFGPGQIIPFKAGSPDRPEPIQIPARPDIALEGANQTKEEINRGFYTNLFQLVDLNRMTTVEVQQRTSENMQILTPVLSRFNYDLLRPLIDRTFAIALRRGLIDPPPSGLEGRNLQVKFISLMAQAQKYSEANTIQQWMGVIAGFANVKPEILDVVNGDEMVKYLGISYSVPQKLLVNTSQVQQVREQRAQQMQQAQATAQAGAESEIADNTASAQRTTAEAQAIQDEV